MKTITVEVPDWAQFLEWSEGHIAAFGAMSGNGIDIIKVQRGASSWGVYFGGQWEWGYATMDGAVQLAESVAKANGGWA